MHWALPLLMVTFLASFNCSRKRKYFHTDSESLVLDETAPLLDRPTFGVDCRPIRTIHTCSTDTYFAQACIGQWWVRQRQGG